MEIGWVGLGSIGTNMVAQLVAAGHAVTVYARGKGLEEVRAAGAATSSDYAGLAAACDLLGICVFDDAQLRSVLFDHGALAALAPGAILAVHTTGSPDLARRIAAEAPAGVAVLDATFSGGPADIRAGKLTLLIGGEAVDIDRARPAFAAYADRIFHAGPAGHGQMLKLLNNLLFATNLKNAADLLTMAERQGFATGDAARAIMACSGASYAMRLFESGGAVADTLARSRPYMEKDVAIALKNASDAGIDVAAFDPVAAFYRKA